jgi:GDP-D-mannose dehydratase
MSFVPTSWSQPVLTGEFTGLGVTRLLGSRPRRRLPRGSYLPGLQQ